MSKFKSTLDFFKYYGFSEVESVRFAFMVQSYVESKARGKPFSIDDDTLKKIESYLEVFDEEKADVP